MKIRDEIYQILYKSSRISSGVRCSNEDEWPIDQLTALYSQAFAEWREKVEEVDIMLAMVQSDTNSSAETIVLIRNIRKYVQTIEKRLDEVEAEHIDK